jgi:hypothetical protein
MTDIIFFIWRIFLVVLVGSIILLYFFWAKILERDYRKRFTLSLVIRQRLSEINGFQLLEEIETHKGRIQEYVRELKAREPLINPPVGQNISELVPPRSN